MNRTWAVFEKIIAVTQIVMGFGLVYFAFSHIELWNRTSVLLKYKPTIQNALMIERAQILDGALFLTAGILMLFNKRIAWMMSFALWFFWLMNFLFQSFFNTDPIEQDMTTFILLCLLQVAFLIFLLLKPIIDKYKVTRIDWATTLVMVMLISLDRYWHSIFY